MFDMLASFTNRAASPPTIKQIDVVGSLLVETRPALVVNSGLKTRPTCSAKKRTTSSANNREGCCWSSQRTILKYKSSLLWDHCRHASYTVTIREESIHIQFISKGAGDCHLQRQTSRYL